MDSRRLVVWISAGILGFQGVTLALDLIQCSLLSWLYLDRHGLESVPALPPSTAASAPGVGANASSPAVSGPRRSSPAAALLRPAPFVPAERAAPNLTSTDPLGGLPAPAPLPMPLSLDPVGHFCQRPRDRIDAAVSQGLTILAGLALGGSMGGGGNGLP
jgi:hypothetical protein